MRMRRLYILSFLAVSCGALLLCGGTSVAETKKARITPVHSTGVSRVTSRIAFVIPGKFVKESDIFLGWVQPSPDDQITMDTSGRTSIEGNGAVLDPDGQPGQITINDSEDQSVNIMPVNIRTGNAVRSMSFICSLNGAADADCGDMSPVTGVKKKNVNIGIHMTMGDQEPSSEEEVAASSFDIAVVYQ